MTFDRDTISTAVKNLINQYGDDALVEIDLRIEELRLLQHDDALALWIEIRKAICFEIQTSTDKPTH
jgi:hypothetical protein